MVIRRVLMTLAILTLAMLAFPASPAAACPPDDDCGVYVEPVGPVGPQGPEALYDPNTELYLFNDGSTSSTYDPPSWHEPTFQDFIDREIYLFEHLFDGLDRYEPGPADGCCGIRG